LTSEKTFIAIDALEKKPTIYLKTLLEILPEAFAVKKQQDVSKTIQK
jgi:hypothetical protein